MGIASCIIALIAILSLVLLVGVIGAASKSFSSQPAGDSEIYYLYGGWSFGAILLFVIGVVFGIGGVLQKQRRRTFAIIGLMTNIGVPLLVMFVFILALTFARSSGTYKAEPWDSSAWDSPFARTSRWLTLGMAMLVAYRFWIKRHKSGVPAQNVGKITNCVQCGKPVPAAARFCRRCGKAVIAESV